MNGVHDAQRLKELQALDLNYKIMITQARIIDWYEHYNGNVYVSFSGGKDSTVLLHIARKMFPDIPAVFSNTGLEYYQIQRFAKQHDNVTFIAPKIRFDQVVSSFGYPLISKEVAEAIYYARRINSQSVQVERERESGGGPNCLTQGAGTYGKQVDWKRLEMRGGDSTPYPDGNSEEPQNSVARPIGRETICKRTELGGQIRRRLEISGTLTTNEQQNRQRRAGVVGAPTNRESGTDGFCQGSEVPPG